MKSTTKSTQEFINESIEQNERIRELELRILNLTNCVQDLVPVLDQLMFEVFGEEFEVLH